MTKDRQQARARKENERAEVEFYVTTLFIQMWIGFAAIGITTFYSSGLVLFICCVAVLLWPAFLFFKNSLPTFAAIDTAAAAATACVVLIIGRFLLI